MKNSQTLRLTQIFLIGLILPIIGLACRISIPDNDPVLFTPPALTVPTMAVPSLADISIPQIVQDEQSLLITLYKRVNPAVVNITIYGTPQNDLIALGQGSGFVYDANGNIITNAHVVHGAEQIEVGFWDGTIRQAKLVGEDLNSDLAIVKVENLPADVQALPLGNIDEVQVGQTVVAIGNPFGLDGTLTRGIVSAIGRTIPALTPFSIPKAIQTDAPINPGNSGGPLLNLQGEVIGVNAQIETNGDSPANSGVGFAIPVSILQRVVPELIANGSYNWAWLGVRGSNLSPLTAQAMNLPVEKGAYIAEVITDGPAAKAGLQGSDRTDTINGRVIPIGGDIITAINGVQINSFDDLLIFIALETSPDEEVTLTVFRNGKVQEIPLTLEARPGSLQTEAAP